VATTKKQQSTLTFNEKSKVKEDKENEPVTNLEAKSSVEPSDSKMEDEEGEGTRL
jgi:hypothetical protein